MHLCYENFMSEEPTILKGKIVSFDAIQVQLPDDLKIVTNTAIGTNKCARLVVDFGAAATREAGYTPYQRFGIIPKETFAMLKKSGLGTVGREVWAELDMGGTTPIVLNCHPVN